MKKVLDISIVRTDGGTQSRKNIDPKWVKDYAESMKEGAVFPPPVTFFDGTEYWLGDGFHRVAAMKSNGLTKAEFEVIEGTVRQAKLYSIRVNNFHGRNMTFDEKRNNIIWMLKDEEYGQWSDEKIAQEGGVNRITVFRIRKKLEKEGQIAPKSTVKYTSKDGKEKTMAVKSSPPAEEKQDPTEEKQEPPKEEPAKEEEVDPDELEVIQMADTISDLKEENEKLKEQVALGLFEGNEFEKMDIQEMLADLREKNRLLELENKTLRDSRDAYQYENAELIKTVKSLKAKLKKLGAE